MKVLGSGGVPGPVPVTGSEEAMPTRKNVPTAMSQVPQPPPRLVQWWEALDTWKQLAISFPVFAVLTFLLNIGPFNQAILRSVFYGAFEGAVLAGVLGAATPTERRPPSRRPGRSRDPPRASQAFTRRAFPPPNFLMLT